MKKILFFVAAGTFAATMLASCGKSTKGKMDNEWTIAKMTSTSTNTDENGNSSTSSRSLDGTNYTITNGSFSSTSTVTEASMKIMKDGTWERSLVITDTENGVTSVSNTTESGNWDFLNGVGEFKKNERVSFSTMKSTSINSTTISGVTSTNTYSNTYADGENTMVYVVVESKGKSLELKYNGNNSYTDSNGTTTNVTEETLSLTAE